MEEEEKEKLQSAIEKEIERKNLEKEIADIFYKMCPNVPPQMLATAVRQTIENFRELDKIYNPKIKKDYKANAIDSLKYANELILSKDTIIGKPETATEIKMFYENENHIPRI